MRPAQNPDDQNSGRNYEHLFKIFDTAIKELTEIESYNMHEIADILLEAVTPKILEMDKSEVPADIREFLESWLALHDALETAEATPIPSGSEQEILKFLVGEYNKLAAMMESIREWIVEESPRTIPPLIIFYALAMYNHAIYLNHLHRDRDLFGSELPDKPHSHGNEAPEEEEFEEDGPEEEDEEPDDPDKVT